MQLSRREAMILFGAPALPAAGRAVRTRELPETSRVTIREEADWYMHSAGVCTVGNEIVATYRRSDEHIASYVEVWCCRSRDGGRTWSDHKLLTKLGWDTDKAAWVAPQLGKTRDGILLLLIDRGEKTSKWDWPMLSQWQQPPRGMSNWLMTSRDGGRTWDGPRKIDNVGGEPGYIIELSNGSWMYTRTDSAPTTAKKYPSMPWGANYYKSTAVFSDDKGKTWNRTVPISYDPLVGDCEVGAVEYEPGRLLAISRIGDAGSALGQPSRFIFSDDFGKTWGKPVLSPIYGHRVYVRKLRDGRLFATFRNGSNGTTGTCGWSFRANEKLSYQPQSFVWDESRSMIRGDALEVKTGNGTAEAVQYMLYPMEDDDSSLELEFDLAVKEAGPNGCNVCAGGWIRFTPKRIEVADRPSEGFDIDTTGWHRYKLTNKNYELVLHVDGKERLKAPTKGIYERAVRFGNRSGRLASLPGTYRNDQTGRRPLRGIQFEGNNGLSLWRSFRASIRNRRDHSVDWSWTPKGGVPDQFRRDRVILLERNATFISGDSGYSSWDESPDGQIVVVDYTGGNPPRSHPFLRGYRFKP